MPDVTEIYLNLPVDDLDRSRTFYRALGFQIDDQSSDETVVMCKASDTINVMLLTKPFFQRFTAAEIADTATHAGVIVSLRLPTREAVDELQAKALAAGGGPSKGDLQEGGLYARSFRDPDGNHWEAMYYAGGTDATT